MHSGSNSSSIMSKTRYISLGGLAVFAIISVFFYSGYASQAYDRIKPETYASTQFHDINKPLPLPAAYEPFLKHSQLQGDDHKCSERYGTDYIRKLSASATNYCTGDSASQFTCFSHRAHDDRVDSLCVGTPAAYNAETYTFELSCQLQDGGEAHQAPLLEELPEYWDGAGPKYIIKDHVGFNEHLLTSARPRGFTFLVKRERGVTNLWHQMMEIISFTFSLDVLRTTIDARTGNPYFTEEDENRSQVVIVDEWDDGPLWDLWQIFSGIKTVRLPALHLEQATTIVTPMPGASNPLWHGHWTGLDCGQSAMYKAFPGRVLDFFNITDPASREDKPFRVTFIDRINSRRLLNTDELLVAFLKKYPDVEAEVIDYAKLNFREQLAKTRASDILVGAHGAGLTHGMFLPWGGTLVEILPHQLFFHGFENMAKFTGHRYLSGRTQKFESPDNTGEWHHDNLWMSEDEFMKMMDDAMGHHAT